jgi:hypothetical protein
LTSLAVRSSAQGATKGKFENLGFGGLSIQKLAAKPENVITSTAQGKFKKIDYTNQHGCVSYCEKIHTNQRRQSKARMAHGTQQQRQQHCKPRAIHRQTRRRIKHTSTKRNDRTNN